MHMTRHGWPICECASRVLPGSVSIMRITREAYMHIYGACMGSAPGAMKVVYSDYHTLYSGVRRGGSE
jgi:hypothetical protein